MQTTSDQTLASLATGHAAASRVFHRHGLDFCCGGRRTLQAACDEAGLDADALLAELDAAIEADPAPSPNWPDAPIADLVQHILDAFHADHREELPRLIAMAEKVENVHADNASCPVGLAQFLGGLAESLEDHMQKEEQVLFPLILAGGGERASMPIRCMESEHDDHGQNLARLRTLAHDFEAPAGACDTWRALYLGLARLEEDVMQHVHLENNVLFPRALRG